MGGYTTYNEKRKWDLLHGEKLSDFRNHPVALKNLDLKKLNLFTANKKSHSNRILGSSVGVKEKSKANNLNNDSPLNRHHQSPLEQTPTKNRPDKKNVNLVLESSFAPNRHLTTKSDLPVSKNKLKSPDDESSDRPVKNIPEISSAVFGELQHLFDKTKSEGSDLKFFVIEEAKNSKKSDTSKPCEEKSVQVDWTMVLETREVHPFELHSSTPNLSEENKRREDIRKSRKSVSDSEDDDERHRIFSRTEKIMDASRQREDNLIAHLRDYRSRLERLHRVIALRDSNIGRLEVEINRLREVLVECRGKEKEMQSLISDLQFNLTDHEAQYDEDMTLCQLREAELRHAIDQLTFDNKHLRAENSRLNSDLLKTLNHRPRTATHSPNRVRSTSDGKHLSMENGNGNQGSLNGRQSRSYDALSTTAQKDSESPPFRYQTSKPTDQKVFLNGRIIMSHSTNLQQIFRLHADFLNPIQLKPEEDRCGNAIGEKNESQTRGYFPNNEENDQGHLEITRQSTKEGANQVSQYKQIQQKQETPQDAETPPIYRKHPKHLNDTNVNPNQHNYLHHVTTLQHQQQPQDQQQQQQLSKHNKHSNQQQKLLPQSQTKSNDMKVVT